MLKVQTNGCNNKLQHISKFGVRRDIRSVHSNAAGEDGSLGQKRLTIFPPPQVEPAAQAGKMNRQGRFKILGL